MSASPQTLPHLNSPPSPTNLPSSQLASLLADSYREVESLRRELASAKKRIEKAERLLATYTQPTAANGAASNTLQISETTLHDLENRVERAEAACDESEARRRAISDAWSQLERQLQALEIHAADARSSFSRTVLEGAVQFSVNTLPLQAHISHSPIAMPPPPHSSRHHHTAPSRSASLRGGAVTPFSNIPLPPPPNPNIYPQNRVRPRANSIDDPTGLPRQPPTKRSRADRSREHDSERRGREERTPYSDSPVDSPHGHFPHVQSMHRQPLPDHHPFSTHNTHSPTQTHSQLHSRSVRGSGQEDLPQQQHHQRRFPSDSTTQHAGETVSGPSHHRGRRRSRPASRGSRSRSRSSGRSSLSVDEMIIQATADDPDRRGNTSLNGFASGSAPTPPPHAVRLHSSHPKRPLPESGYSRLPLESPSVDYHRHHSASRPPRNSSHPIPSQSNIMTGPGMNSEGPVGPLSQPGQVQTYQTHVFAPVVTGAPVKKSKFLGTAGSVGGLSPIPSAGIPSGPVTSGITSQNINTVASEVPPPLSSYPPTNAQGQRICRQCGHPGRYKDNKCVEKWGPGPFGPGTVCDRCRKKMKRVERRGTLEPHQLLQQSSGHTIPHAPSPLPARRPPSRSRSVQIPGSQASERPIHRSDTLIVSSNLSGGTQIDSSSTHVISTPQPSYIQHDRSPPAAKVARTAPPSPLPVATHNDNHDPPDRSASSRFIGPGSRAQSRSSSQNGRVPATAPFPERSPSSVPGGNSARDSPRPGLPSKRSPVNTDRSPSTGSKSKRDSTAGGDVDIDVDANAELDVDTNVDLRPDVEMDAEAEVDADADADADTELMEAVDAAEANSSGGNPWMKKEDS